MKKEIVIDGVTYYREELNVGLEFTRDHPALIAYVTDKEDVEAFFREYIFKLSTEIAEKRLKDLLSEKIAKLLNL